MVLLKTTTITKKIYIYYFSASSSCTYRQSCNIMVWMGWYLLLLTR
ncbi:hypothetical protein AB162_152 [Candidatus Palibaumannia cicadellinicola]|uniref:Uncharacterized protein n=1 Tax=Candidatus Palibaumannia cicadellinicola TaxID=186490 RepID=A0A0K2BKP6_9GAMM|nr:hypothetical protein AB162_152 [Candidatus Baumannia cicadellinicola]